jgi:dTDP-4-dehydrorhamnose reductase
MKFLILGGKGQLGTRMADDLNAFGMVNYACDIDDVDICNYKQLKFLINDFQPNTIINCAAYNNVEAAEDNWEAAYEVNSKAPEYLAELANDISANLVHYSTDYVFDGYANAPYREADEANPINIYGKSKLIGENAVEQIAKRSLIFRTSWLYSKGEQNFIGKFLALAKDNPKVRVSTNEISIPTSARLIVDLTLKAMEQDLEGLYHLTNSGFCSRFEFAEFIVKTLGLNNEILPCKKEDFGVLVQRPEYSVLDNRTIKRCLQIEIPDWQNDLEACLQKHYAK